MAGAEGGSGEWVKTLSLSLPAGCSAAMRYTSLQLTHVLWRSVSHTLDSSVDWPWLIAAGLCIEKKKPGRCVCVNLYIIMSTRPVRVRPVQPRGGGRCCLDPQWGLRWCLVRWPSVTIENTAVKDTAPLQQIIRLGLSLRCLPDLLYDICIQFACVLGASPSEAWGSCGRNEQMLLWGHTVEVSGKMGEGRMLTCRQVVSQNI